MSTLARFRADPEVIRVGIRRERGGWLVTVSYRGAIRYGTVPAQGGRAERRIRIRESPTGKPITAWSEDVEAAVMRALKDAEKHGMAGIDLGMGRAHDHPQAV